MCKRKRQMASTLLESWNQSQSSLNRFHNFIRNTKRDEGTLGLDKQNNRN